MKNKFFFIVLIIFYNSLASADNVLIQAKNITIDKKKQITIFENEVNIKTYDNNTIQSNYAEYNKGTGQINLKGKITAIDNRNNIIKSNFAEYNDNTKIFRSIGYTKIITSEKYLIESENVTFDNKNYFIKSENNTTIKDQDGNFIYLENFDYQTKNNIFKSIGFVEISDNSQNKYKFSQIYIDTQKKEILGTDIKAFMNDDDFKINKDNKPRIFSNAVRITNEKSDFSKSIFTICNYREGDKCPPWTIQSSKMLHDNKKKTIYYDNAIIKVYDIPIFYLPKLSHPDPTVDRRSGFLPPSFSDSKNLGSGISIPYFLDLGIDKNFTFTNKFYVSENPLLIGEYHQAFKNSYLLTDFGYTKGYKKTSSSKKAGEKSHFFSKYSKNFSSNDNESTLNVSIQNTSNDKYLKLYKIDSNLVDYNTEILENSLDYTLQSDDTFFGLNASVYETLNETYNDKYEYILPEITIDKNLASNNKIGNLDLQSNFKTHNYDTNRLTNFFINDLYWNYNEIDFKSGFKGKILGNLKNINYETKNVDLYKEETTSELFGALGYLTEIDLIKKIGSTSHLFKPKILLRYSPGSMRKEESGSKLDPISAFSIDRLNNINNFETGLTSTIGFDYTIKKNNKDFDFSVAQIVSEKENKKMHAKTSMDEKLSDLVGSADYKINDRFSLNYNFSIDQNYNEFNYSEAGMALSFDSLKVNFNYLEERKHIGDQEYFKTKLDYNNKNSLVSLETKRNLITNSAEFYNLSYEYLNDCLRAGLVYRREFYTDSEIEPENSLMFKITLTPFGNINTPSFSQ